MNGRSGFSVAGDEDLAEGGDLLGVRGAHGGILAGLLRVEANVLQQHHVAVVHRGDLGLGILAVGVLGQRDLDAEQLAQTLGDRGQRQLRDDLALRTAEVGHQDDLGAFFAKRRDSRQRGLDTAIIGNRGAVQRDVEIGAHQNALALEISEILECLHVYPFLSAYARNGRF